LEPVTHRVNILRGVGTGAKNAVKTHCKRGHEFTPENTRRTEAGRTCVTCIRAAGAAHMRARRAKLKASK